MAEGEGLVAKYVCARIQRGAKELRHFLTHSIDVLVLYTFTPLASLYYHFRNITRSAS